MKMEIYTENRDVTSKTEYTDTDMIGWSVLDAAPIYRATVTEFSIADGITARYTKAVNADGSEYRPTHYRNIFNGFTPTYMA